MRLEVTENLDRALLSISHAAPEGLLWVDSVCINQKDLIEKSSQVRMMCEIFSHSVETIFWLGEEGEHDRQAYRLVEQIAAGTIPPFQSDEYAIFDEQWQHLYRLFEKPWFSRIWIIQEFLMARSGVFVCGELILDPEIVLEAAWKMPPQMKSIRLACRSMKHSGERLWATNRRLWTLEIPNIETRNQAWKIVVSHDETRLAKNERYDEIEAFVLRLAMGCVPGYTIVGWVLQKKFLMSTICGRTISGIVAFVLAKNIFRGLVRLDPDYIIDPRSARLKPGRSSKKTPLFEGNFTRIAIGRRFCRTKAGYLDWVSMKAREGDTIIAFPGCQVLYAVREINGDPSEAALGLSNDQQCRLTGDCLIYGL